MKGTMRVETTASFEKSLKLEDLGEEVKKDDREFLETEVHFNKNQLGEFYRFEDWMIVIISGRRYDFLYEEELYNKLVMIHE